jgi:hypothetical protein
VRVKKSIVAEEPIYHRKESSSQTAEDARKQIASQEIWGGPARNFKPSDIPKVKAYIGELPLTNNGVKAKGIEFTTKADLDRGLPRGVFLWSGDREGVRTEDGYAKIKVEITFCNQLDEE